MEKNLEEIASLIGGSVVGDAREVISGVASLEDAGPRDITFLSDKKYSRLLSSTKAGAVILRDPADAPSGLNVIVSRNPQLAFAKLIALFRPDEHPGPGRHPKAEIHPGAEIGEGASIQAFVVIEEGAKIGGRAVLYPGVYVGRNAEVGPDCVLFPGVVVREGCKVGSRVIVHSNTVIGSDGFGYAKDGAKSVKIPQKGIVRVGDDVELGACVTIDRASLGETVIGRGAKIDNLVQIAHNVKIGEDAVIVAQTGIAGSTRIGDRVVLGGQVGVVGHIEIGDDTMIGAKSGVTNNVPTKTVYSGIPAIPHGEWLRAHAVLPKLPELKKKVAELEKMIISLEEELKKEREG